MSQAKNSTEVLKAAKWMLENVGWCQESYEKYDTGGNIVAFCVEGAVMAVEATNGNHNTRAIKRLEKVVPGGNPVRFNDRKGTTKTMVLRAFARAIKGKKK